MDCGALKKRGAGRAPTRTSRQYFCAHALLRARQPSRGADVSLRDRTPAPPPALLYSDDFLPPRVHHFSQIQAVVRRARVARALDEV